jgi:tryptophan synthase alpha chain
MEIKEKFRELSEEKEGAYMAHIYYGDPNEEFSLSQIETLVKHGADFIEFGIPFSDPTADGAIFQAACERALRNGITPPKCIQGIKKLRENLDVPIIVTTYYNIPYIAGVKAFLSEIKEAGAQGIIVPDVSLEEANPLLDAGREARIHVIFQVTPLTTEARLRRIAAATSGFLYVVNVEGVTGARESLADSTLKLVNRVRKHSDIPIMAGFGISKKEHAAAVVSAGADGVITGSALGEIYQKNLENPEETLPKIAQFAGQIKQGCIEGYIQRLNAQNISYEEV